MTATATARRSGSGAARTSAPRRRRSRARSSIGSPPGESRPEDICVLTGASARESRLIAAALEERNVPFRSSGSAAFFGRPEVRDAIAWLRALADPNDSAAVVRALTRPPVELRSVDLARCTTIARRRKLDMISAVEAALESPQLPPPSRDRLRAFLKLYRAAAGAFDGLRADVFVRRLIERVGFRRHGLFAASPETAERLVNLSRLAELAAGWTRRRPDGSTRDFVRYLAAVGEAGQRFSRPAEPPPRGRRPARRARAGQGHGLRPRLPPRPRPRRASLGGRADRLDPARAARGRAPARRGRRRRAPRPPRLPGAEPGPDVGRPLPSRGGAGRRASAALADLRGDPRRARRDRGAARGGAVRPGRGPARDLPDAPRRGARGIVAGRGGAERDAPRHRRGRQPRGRPLLRAAEAGGADPAPRQRVGARGDRRAERADRPDRDPRAARRAERSALDEYVARRGPRPDPRAARSSRAGASRASRRSCRSAAAGWRCRRRTSTSTGPARSSTSSRASSRSRRSRRSTSASGSSSTTSSSATTPRRSARPPREPPTTAA